MSEQLAIFFLLARHISSLNSKNLGLSYLKVQGCE